MRLSVVCAPPFGDAPIDSTQKQIGLCLLCHPGMADRESVNRHLPLCQTRALRPKFPIQGARNPLPITTTTPINYSRRRHHRYQMPV